MRGENAEIVLAPERCKGGFGVSQELDREAVKCVIFTQADIDLCGCFTDKLTVFNNHTARFSVQRRCFLFATVTTAALKSNCPEQFVKDMCGGDAPEDEDEELPPRH